ncbi:MAG: hypothetical protein AAF480_03695 [Actinomycetota bacterium]
MPLSHRQSAVRTWSLVLSIVLVAVACGGGDSFSIDADPTADPTATPAVAEPTEAPTATAEAADPTPEAEPVDVTEFCFAATKIGEAGEVLDLVDVESPAQLEFGLTRMQDALTAGVDLAPTPSIRAVIEDSDEIIDQLIRLLSVADYDLVSAQEETLEAFVEIGESGEATLDRLETDLTLLIEDDCGIPISQVRANAEDAFNLFFPGGEDPPPTPAPTAPPTAAPVDGTLMLTDDTGIIQVTVPEAWADTDTQFPVEGITRFIAAEIVQGYEESWEIPGVSVAFVSGLGPLTDTEVLEQAQAFDQCLLIDTNPYSDPLYTGTIQTFEQCGQSGTNAAVVVARSAQFGDDFILVEVQYAPGDGAVLDIVLNSFVVTPS